MTEEIEMITKPGTPVPMQEKKTPAPTQEESELSKLFFYLSFIFILAVPLLAVGLMTFLRPDKEASFEQDFTQATDLVLVLLSWLGSTWGLYHFRWNDRIHGHQVLRVFCAIAIPLMCLFLGAFMSAAFRLALKEPVTNIWSWSRCDAPSPPESTNVCSGVRPSPVGAAVMCTTFVLGIILRKYGHRRFSVGVPIILILLLIIRQSTVSCLLWTTFLVQTIPVALIAHLAARVCAL